MAIHITVTSGSEYTIQSLNSLYTQGSTTATLETVGWVDPKLKWQH